MKKTYTKPTIMFEDFTLSTSIAAGCELTPNTFANFNNCAHRIGDLFFFGSDLTGCTKFADKSRPVDAYSGTIINNDTVCYHTPSDVNNIFNS